MPSAKEKEASVGFKVEHLFGSKTRSRLLQLFVNSPEDVFYVRELTRKIGAQLNSVRRELNNLIGLGIVKEVDVVGEKGARKDKKFYAVNTDFELFQDLRSFLKKVQIIVKKDLNKNINRKNNIKLLVMTGKLLDVEDVPVDLLVVGSIKDRELKEMLQEFEEECMQEVNFTLMPVDEYKYRKEVSDRFLYTILSAEKVVMINELGQDV